jgi:hypothetical protein
MLDFYSHKAAIPSERIAKSGCGKIIPQNVFGAPVMDNVVPPRDARGRLKQLPAPMRAHLWQRGQSGNPGGRGGDYQRCMQLCREASYESAQEIIRLGRESDDERVRYMANTWVYERAWGKPKEYDPRAEELEAAPIDPSRFTAKQRAMIRRMLTLLLSATPTEDAANIATGPPEPVE